ncbi:MAG: cysteine protease [Ignavibacteriae bacterium]|nr:cysteine protease [Ignavibacteriota bacterium]NOG98243.1 cysteine protease [Ignavibacteriota bacterium]
MKSYLKTIIILFVLVVTAYAQKPGMGLFLDDKYFENSPKAAPLMRGDYDNLPSAYSLKEFAPTPGSQGLHGTCTGWSTSYAGRTILEALRNRWSREEVDKNSFSPSYVYNQIRTTNDCFGGASIIDALDVLRLQGDVKLNDFGYLCERDVTADDKTKALEYKIIEYREVAYKTTNNKTERVKKSLSEDKPVVIAMDIPNSFIDAGEVWLPDSGDYRRWSQGHGMAIVGYDDNKFGGAFEIMNSWGTDWGNNGFTWMRYSDFEYFVLFAFELIDESKPEPTVPDLSGKLSFIESSGYPMESTFNGKYFETDEPYYSGTLFELRVSNSEPAYVYAFSYDLSNSVYKIFPFHNKMVAYLPYRQNNVAIPDEESYNMLDATTGTTFYCFLYSKEELKIDEIMDAVKSSNGNFWQRLTNSIGHKFVDQNFITYKDGNNIEFSAFSNGKSVVPVILEIPHN